MSSTLWDIYKYHSFIAFLQIIFYTEVKCGSQKRSSFKGVARSCIECPGTFGSTTINACDGDCEWAIYSEKNYHCTKRGA